jgi:hypothetical protein
MGFQPNFTGGVISTIPSCAHRQHILLLCTKWLPELKKEKSCPAYTGQTAGRIFTKIRRSSVPFLVVHITACSPLLHKIAVEKSCLAFKGQATGGISMKLHMSDHTLFWETYVFVTKTLLVKRCV